MNKKVIKYLEEKIANVTKSDAYWISPSGKIKSVTDRHIHEVYNNPEAFGTSREEIEKAYKKFREKIGTEGNAREEIIKSILLRGWIRIRKYRDSWSININKLNSRNKEYLFDWATEMIKNKEDKYMAVNINTPKGNDFMTVQDIAKFNFNEESVKPTVRKYILEWVKEF